MTEESLTIRKGKMFRISVIYNILLKTYRILQLGVSYFFKMLIPLGPPYQFTIEATNRCNLKCVFCPQSKPSHKDARDVGDLSLTDFVVILKKSRRPSAGIR